MFCIGGHIMLCITEQRVFITIFYGPETCTNVFFMGSQTVFQELGSQNPASAKTYIATVQSLYNAMFGAHSNGLCNK